ncbi:MAG TPA: hypothetical protein VK617_09580 [Gemmatimonadaceae bacterium]|nr:hypothetical protein [Gemmatimonadaceae bacterium]
MNRWLIALSFVTVTAQAQTGAAGTIDPGMTRAQVIERLGKPATVRTYQGSTYLLYSNNCGKTCGMQDLVILDHDVVVDAVFRSPNRHYTGTSSSPDATKPNSRSQRNQPLQVPSSGAAPDSNGATTTLPTLRGNGATTSVPADSALTSTSHPPADSAATSTSRPPADSAPIRSAPAAAGPVPYGKPPTTPPPGDSAKTSTSHPPVDNATSSTSHPPKPPQ